MKAKRITHIFSDLIEEVQICECTNNLVILINYHENLHKHGKGINIQLDQSSQFPNTLTAT